MSEPIKAILVVDDEEEMTQLLKIELELEGYKIFAARNGEGGLKQIKMVKPDLIILDIMMPGMDGYEMMRILKADDMTKDISIVILTARIQEKDIQKGIKMGADLYITKPFDPTKLIRGIQKILSRE